MVVFLCFGSYIWVIPCQNSKFSEKFPLDLLRFCWNFIEMGFLMNNEDLQSFSFGSIFVQKICLPQSFAHPPSCKFFLHFRPTLSPHIFGLKLHRLLKLGIFTDIFPLISDMVLNFFELQTFKNARFFKNILFYTFLRGYILHRKYYSHIKLAMLLKYLYETVIKQYEGG